MDDLFQATERLQDEFIGFREDFATFSSEISELVRDLQLAFAFVQDRQLELLAVLQDFPPSLLIESPPDLLTEWLDR